MTTARERAREAAKYLVSGAVADAASDVWEPLLQECCEFIIRSADQTISYDEHYDLVDKLKGALGDG